MTQGPGVKSNIRQVEWKHTLFPPKAAPISAPLVPTFTFYGENNENPNAIKAKHGGNEHLRYQCLTRWARSISLDF